MQRDTRLQVPISWKTKAKLEAKSEELGFGSPTDTVRFLIHNFLKGSINVVIIGDNEKTLSKSDEAEVLEGLADKVKGKVKRVDPRSKNFHKTVLEFADE